VMGMKQFIILDYIVSYLVRRYPRQCYHLRGLQITPSNGQRAPRPP
jgi:hypothetical protein